jgi:hypothetical protein
MTTRFATRFCWTLLTVLAVAGPAVSGLRDIHPRPQQMGLLSSEPVRFSGTPFLVIPDTPTTEESRVRNEAVRMMLERVGRAPALLSWSEYTGQSPAIWLGTLARFPALAAALDSTGLAGFGTTTHAEEYQLVIQDQRVLLGASDTRGLRWGWMSLMRLMAEVMGSLYVDRAAIRDWPDLAKRVSTINNALRSGTETDWSNQVADLSYVARVNEIEWNQSDLSVQGQSAYSLAQSLALAGKIRTYGMDISSSVETFGKNVDQLFWQEGVPVNGMKMRVTASGFERVPNCWAWNLVNGNFESWTGNRPTGWTMAAQEHYASLFRDNVIRHSGSSAARIVVPTGSPSGRDLWQAVHLEPRQWLRVKLWYKIQDFVGTVRIYFYDDDEPYNYWDLRLLAYGTPTTLDWTYVEFDMATYGGGDCYLMLGPAPATQGTVWLDDISLECGDLQEMVRRPDTPLEVYRGPQRQLMTEGRDYRVVETYGTSYEQYVRSPRIERLDGGRLAVGDTASINWHVAVKWAGSKRTVCFSLLEPLVAYQSKIRRIDSLIHPDGFKIHIHEVAYANYDELCTSRGLTPGRLVGRFCRQLYDIIQAQRPGAPVRIYGDVCDDFVRDTRAMPVTVSSWTVGALDELPDSMEIMAMEEYSLNLDSSMVFFQAHHHPCVADAHLCESHWRSADAFVTAASAARAHPVTCRGMHFHMWQGTCDGDLPLKIPLFGDLAWNMGPFIVHTPVPPVVRSDSLVIVAEMWSDSFGQSTPPSLTTTTLHYRLLPSQTWMTSPFVRTATDVYAATIRSIGSGATALEYYIRVTDDRAQARTAPADAPQHVYYVDLPASATPPPGRSGGELIRHSIRMLHGHRIVEWTPRADVAWYEIHVGDRPDFGKDSRTRLAIQSPECPRFLIPADEDRSGDSLAIHVYGIRSSKDGSAMERRLIGR